MVDNATKEKRRLWKEWKAGGSKESYLEAERKQGRKFILLSNRLRKRDSQIF